MRIPDIQICPIKKLYRLLAEGDRDRCAAMISSSTPVDTQKLGAISYVFRQYEDIDCDVPGRSFCEEDAKVFAHFLLKLDKRTDTIYCCCDAGESRSPAIAAAVMRFYSMDDEHIWKNPHYHPNMLVFDILAGALGNPVSDEEKDYLLYINQKAFRDAVRGE